MRIFLIIAVILCFLSLGISYFTGMIAEQQLSGIQDNLAEQQHIQLLSTQHQRGWLSSNAASQVKLPQGIGKIDLQHQISHGLVPVKAVNVKTFMGFNENLNEQLQVYLGDIGKPEIQTQIIPLRPITAKINLPRPNSKENALVGNVQFTPGTAQIEGEFFLNTLQIPQWLRAVELHATDIQIHTESSAVQSISLRTQLNPQHAQLDLLHQEDLVLQQAEVKLQAQLQADLLNVHIDVFVPYLQAGGKAFEQLKLVLHVQNIDWQIMQQLLDLLQKPPMQQRFMLPMFLLQNAKPFLSRQPSVHLKQFDAHNSQGQLHSKLTLNVDPAAKGKLGSLSGLLQALQVQTDVSLGKTLAQQVLSIYLIETQGNLSPAQAEQMSQEMLRQHMQLWQKRGWITEDEKNYRSQLQWKNGKLQTCIDCIS